LVINEILADPDATNGDANGDGTVSTSQDEFVEIVNNSNSAIDLSGYQIFDAVGVRHVFPNGTFIQPNDVIVVFGGGTPTGFDHLDVQTASAGFLGFNNGGDDVIIKDPSDITVTSVTYGSEGGDNQSLVRNPDVTGSFVKHSTLPGGALFSPAKKIDDTFFKTPNVWSGAAKSTDWGTAGNWSDGIPDSDNRVVIPASLSTYPIITAAATCNSLVMEEGASLLGQENLTINGTATVETSYVGYTSNMDGWYLIGTPVGTFDINGSDFDPGDPDDFYGWSETENLWKNHKAGFPLQVVPGIGNLVAYSPGNAGTKRFIGSLNSSSYSPTLSNSTSSWNLVGNPYCSPVDWSEVAITDVSSPKVLDNTDGSYDDVTDDINTAQGVFVYAESGSSTLAFETADQTHGSAKKADPVFATLKAQFDNNDVYIRLGANEQASLDYEWQHDARYLAPISEIPNLAAITGDDIMVSTYVLNPNTETALVPLSFAVSADQEITFGLEGQFGFKVTLEDLSNGIMTALTEGNTYTYSAQTSDDPERFHLHLIKSSFGIGEGEDLEGVHAYSSGQNLYVNVQQDLTGATVAVFNTLGQELVSKSLAGGLETLRMEQPGVYIVTVKASQGTYATKLIIQ
jgi:hypothetical protein